MKKFSSIFLAWTSARQWPGAVKRGSMSQLSTLKKWAERGEFAYTHSSPIWNGMVEGDTKLGIAIDTGLRIESQHAAGFLLNKTKKIPLSCLLYTSDAADE